MPLPKKIPRSGIGRGKAAPESKRILANRYEVEKKLGSGNFGTAWLVKDLKCKDPKEEWKVLKEISVGDLQPDETVDAMHEAKLLSKLDNPGIVKFHDSFIDGEFFCIITEFCEGGDLGDFISDAQKKGKHTDEKLVMDWFVQLLLAVKHMHDRRVLHRDLKTRNIFLRNNMVKIGDFGISRILMGTSDLATTFTGTPYYMSPEVLKHEGYNSKSDIWSIGCILYEVCAHKHAFDGQSLMGVMYKIVEGGVPALPDGYSKDLTTIFNHMLTKDPVKRPSASELLKLPFIEKHMQKMKNVMSDQRNAKELSESAKKEAQDIQSELKKKTRLHDLQEEDPYKHLTPRERMRLRKQHEADMKAKKLKEAAEQNLLDNQTRKAIRSVEVQHPVSPPWSPHYEGQKKFQVPVERLADVGYHSRPGTAPERPIERYDDDDDDDDDSFGMKTTPVTMIERDMLRVGKQDDRPITPMKNKMVYDVSNSTLDFKDGIPEDPVLAETYYSQYDEFEEADDDDDDDDDDEEDDEESGDDENGHEMGTDEDALVKLMSEHLGKEDPAEKSMTVMDDSIAGAFGPSARAIKIKNLRVECEEKFGKKAFQQAYDYLRKARFGDEAGNTMDEMHIMNGLRKFVSNPSDCFLVDQLLFLEEQAKIYK